MSHVCLCESSYWLEHKNSYLAREPSSFKTIAAARQKEMNESIIEVATMTFVPRLSIKT
jgi:hypothetical protein